MPARFIDTYHRFDFSKRTCGVPSIVLHFITWQNVCRMRRKLRRPAAKTGLAHRRAGVFDSEADSIDL